MNGRVRTNYAVLIMAALFITLILLLTVVWNGCETVFQSFGVVGGLAFMNWTVSDLDMDTNRFVRNPFDNASLLVFFSGEINPYIFDKRVSYTGDISRGIISFTLSGLTPLDAGIYKYMISAGIGNIYAGSQELVIVAVGVRGGDTWMSWRIIDSSISDFRLVKSPNNTTVLAYLTGSYIALVPPSYTNRLTDIGNLSHGIVSYRLTNVTAADVGRYAFYILGSIDVGGQVLVIADGPENMLLSPRVSLVTVLKGLDMTPVNCSAECFPECIFQWTRSNDSYVVSREPVLKLMNVKLDDSGKYICTASNVNATELKASENFTLSVLDRDEIKTQLSLVSFEDDVAVFNIGYSLNISKPRSLTLQYRAVTTFNATWITERDILLLENQTEPFTVEVSVLKDQHMYSYRAYATFEWGVSGYSSEIVFAIVAKAPGTSTVPSTSSLPIALTGSTAGIFFIITLSLAARHLKSRTRMDSKANEDYAYSSDVAEANDRDLSGSQNVQHYEMLQERRHDHDQDKHYDKIQINITTVSTDASTTETGKI